MSNKVLFVMDMPKNCSKCIFSQMAFANVLFEEGGFYCMIEIESVQEILHESRPDWCPLKPLPDKKNFWEEEHGGKFSSSWNACIDEITGGDE